MKKYLLATLFISLLSCGVSDDFENQSGNPLNTKIRTLTVQDEEIQNGNATLYEKLDFKFEYSQNKLVKIWDIHNNYTEELSYVNNSIKNINISGYLYPQLSNHLFFKVKRNLFYDNNQRIIKSEAVENTGNYRYTTFEYPSADIIIAKTYLQNTFDGSIVWSQKSVIYLSNGNVEKVELWENTIPAMRSKVTKYEYDQKINPNFLIDVNRILALPEYSFNVFELQDYSQISRNNVIKKTKYTVDNNIESVSEIVNVHFSYQNNDLPSSIYLQYDYPGNTGLKVSAIYGY
ncbi:hypothetical protein [Chryseobacterium hagamense]|uniref:DUF4595 domain-containing protein n=1 Tax=Chryseobacterium hagamense TaxID=395935 RepID=A0A511YP26_9FLAO|nr:hypothetical protein [Chryseobacterium hagamense]GEN76940.1 hypothetical protein CHA01nite_26800 [Chryseobacterium hagamense]